jgi:hypothetical protein
MPPKKPMPPWLRAKIAKQNTGAKKTKKPVDKYSRWLITLNVNRRIGDLPYDENTLRQKYKLCAAILEQNRLQPYLYIMDKQHAYGTHVLSVDVDHEVEVAPRQKTLHMHATLVVKHQTRCRLSYPVLRTAFAKILEVPTVHMDCRLIRGVEEGLEAAKAYVHKSATPPE